jgi:uncharacterized protein (DUF58 family)
MSRYFWLLLILTAVALFLRVDFIVYILYVVAGIFLWSRFYTPRAVKHLVVSRDYARRAFLGETVAVNLTVRNDGRLPIPWVQLSESVPPELRIEEQSQRVVALRGRTSESYSYHVRAQQRGYYQLGPLRMISGDVFGLANQQLGYLPPDYLTVYPRIVTLSHLGLPSRLPFGTIASRQRLFEDPARPMGARQFRSGDSLRQINWKASAHTQQLLVRTFQPAISLETVILLNLHQGDYERRDRIYSAEWAVVVAASLASYLIRERQPVGLMSNGVDPLRIQEDEREYDDVTGRLLFRSPALLADKAAGYTSAPIKPHTGRAHLMKMLEQLARVESAGTVAFAQWAPLITLDLSWGMTILAVTARGDDATCNVLHRLARAGYNPVLIAVEPDLNFGQVRERARRLGFRAFNVSGRGGLDQWRRDRGGASLAV